ncbi:MAG: Ig-like domain-containing protein [Lachnospiraceae bacterium]|nr:Ig-like domain-containing protein [Lachnospiraceae bacterium]
MKCKAMFFLAVFFLFFAGMFIPAKAVLAADGLNHKEITLEAGKTKTLKLSGKHRKIRWKSSNNSVANVSKSGVITAKSKGNAFITARAGKNLYVCRVLVYDIDYNDARVVKKVRHIINKKIKADMRTEEIILAIHDYIVMNCAYDVKGIKKGVIPWGSYGPEGVLLKNKAVCQGYAETFQLFMDSLNIPCKLVTGTAKGINHAWNMVKVKGKWYHIDVTWDDPTPEQKGQTRYYYFLIPDNVMDDDHKWKKTAYPKCKATSDKFINLLGEVSHTKDEAIESLFSQTKSGKKNLTLIYTKKYWKSLKVNKIPYYEMRRKYCLETDANASYKYIYYTYGKYIIIKLFV